MDLVDMINLSKNPIFNKMFSLVGEVIIETMPALVNELMTQNC